MGNLTIGPILEHAGKLGASDIHITEGSFLVFRIDGKLKVLESVGKIEKPKIRQMLLELLNDDKINLENFLKNHDIDFSYVHLDGTSFRVNAFYKLGKISFVLRRISNKITPMKELGLPEATKLFTELKQGLILITGPTGAGKSTSMVSILEEINKSRGEHILTIEDPVEFVFQNKKSIFSQREIGQDTNSFPKALRAAMREDPDIIMVGELRDKETVHAALELAETGHLVISTLHTSSAVKTVDRLLSFFPLDSQNLVRGKLSSTLKGVLSQRLIPKVGGGRIGIFELMLITTGIKNLIKTGELQQIQGNIETGSRYGMIHMKKFADKLRDKGLIEEKDYINYFREDDEV